MAVKKKAKHAHGRAAALADQLRAAGIAWAEGSRSADHLTLPADVAFALTDGALGTKPERPDYAEKAAQFIRYHAALRLAEMFAESVGLTVAQLHSALKQQFALDLKATEDAPPLGREMERWLVTLAAERAPTIRSLDVRALAPTIAKVLREHGTKAEQRLQEAELLRARAQQERNLPSVTVYPQMALQNMTATRETWREEHRRQLDLFQRKQLADDSLPATAPDSLLAREARLDVQPAYWDLSTPEWRALHAVYALYSSLGQDGETYAGEYVPEDWPRIFAAAGLPEQEAARGKLGDFSGQRRAEIREGVASLIGKQVPVIISRKGPNGKWTLTAEPVALLERVPFWTDKTDEEAEELRQSPPADWPTPDQWGLKLPKALRWGVNNFYRSIPTDVWHWLESAAEETRGKLGGVQPRDWNFTLWLYQQRPQQRRGRLEIHVNRDKLADMIPALRTYKVARQRKRLADYTEQTYRTAQRAGLLVDYHLDQRTTKGVRDVLVLNPDPAVFPQHSTLPEIAGGEAVASADVAPSSPPVA